MQRYLGGWGTVWVVVLAFHTLGLFSYPRIEADEGGWPLSVRAWVETGAITRDYYMAPGYHWLLGIPFTLLGARHEVARTASVLAGLAALWLFRRLARRVGGGEVAAWSLWLAGTSYGVLLIHRRAFMESWQVLLMVALAVSVVERPGPRWLWRPLAMALTALLLLTKASGVFLLPALVLAAAWPEEKSESEPGPPWWHRAWSVAWVLGAGVVAAAGVFGWLYLNDPVRFVASWTADLTVARTADGGHTPGAGRFALDWHSSWLTIRHLMRLEPLVMVLAAMQVWGAARSSLTMPGGVFGWWLAGGLAFLGLQRSVAEQHRLVLMLPLCFLAAQQLEAWAARPPHEQQPWWRQPRLVLGLVIALSAGRMAVGAWRLPDEHTAVAWLAGQTRGQDSQRVLAAPYVLMRLDARPLSFFALPPPFLPARAALQAHGVEWVAMDKREWRHHARLDGGASPEAMDAALRDCCRLAYDTPMIQVYRVNREDETR